MRPIIGSLDADQFTAGMMGLAVERAAATLPQTTNSPIFTVAGGRALVLSIIGQVTVAIQAQINATKLTAVPTAGTAVDLCATGDINGKEVGALLVPALNAFATALSVTNAGAGPYTYGGAFIAPGTINLNCAASSTGQVKWTLYYVPYDVGATVVAA